MPRLLRCQLEPHLFVEVTARCLGGQLLLRPSKLVNDLIAGVLALAEEHYEVEVVAFVALSNHFHALLIPADGQELSRFMQFVGLRGLVWVGWVWALRVGAARGIEQCVFGA